MTTVDELVARVQAQMSLDSETEHEILAEIREHLAEAVAEGRAAGLDEAGALAQAAARFGVEDEIGRELQAAHAGWGTADAVLAAGLPVVCALILRWLVFAPDGTALGWPQLLSRPSFWIVALVALFIPVFRFERWRYALATWVLFWGLTVLFVMLPALRW
jgi:hypothetical protein